MQRKKPLQSDPAKVQAWRERSARKAAENAKKKPKVGLSRKPVKLAAEKVREVMSKANPPRVDAPSPKPRRSPSHANPGNNATPPVPPGARCVCGCGERAVHMHHVLYRQQLRRLRADASDPRSVVPVAFRCHGDHHSGARRLPLAVLPDAAFDFALEAMGAACYDYLLRRYSGEDPRLDRIIE